MALEARSVGGSPAMTNYTPSSAVSAGQVIVSNGQCLIAHSDIAADKGGALSAPNGSAFYEVSKGTTAAALTFNQIVYWDDTNNVANTATTGTMLGRFNDGTSTTAAGTIVVRNSAN